MNILEYAPRYFVNLSDLVSLWLKLCALFCHAKATAQRVITATFHQLQMDNNQKMNYYA
jgi:hypothetical protein